MTLTLDLRTYIENFLKRRARRNWESDIRVFLKTHEDPYNLAGLELALLHLGRRTVPELSVHQRKQITLTVSVSSVEALMQQIQLSKALIAAGEALTPSFYGKGEPPVVERTVDDFFTTERGHVVRPELIVDSLTERTRQLIELLQQLEAESKTIYPYYMRKMKKLFADLFHTLQAMLESTY